VYFVQRSVRPLNITINDSVIVDRLELLSYIYDKPMDLCKLVFTVFNYASEMWKTELNNFRIDRDS